MGAGGNGWDASLRARRYGWLGCGDAPLNETAYAAFEVFAAVGKRDHAGLLQG